MIMMASWDPACDDELRIRSASAMMNSDEFFHYHLRPRGMMRVEKYETYDFQPLVRVEYQGMQKRYETMILMFLPIASGHNLIVSYCTYPSSMSGNTTRETNRHSHADSSYESRSCRSTPSFG